MAFVSTLENTLSSINEKVQKDLKLKKILEQYNGRSITLDITGDRIYLIKILEDSVKLEPSSEVNDDMFIKADLETAREIFIDHRIDPIKLMGIKTKKIGINEINTIKGIFLS